MLTQDPVKIPDIPGKISFKKSEDKEYVQYLTGREYNTEKKYSEPERVIIGRRCEEMPGLMYPNNKYEEIFKTEGEGMQEEMTPEEERFIRNNKTYGLYIPFFEEIYNEFKREAHKHGDAPMSAYKAESINKVLGPLREMMKEEEYAGFLGMVEGEEMSCSDAMILLVQYKTALAKYRKTRI